MVTPFLRVFYYIQKTISRKRKLIAWFCVVWAGTMLGLSGAAAAQAVVQSYNTNSSVQTGMIVLLATDKTTVKPVASNNMSEMLGVVIDPSNAAVTLSGGGNQQAYVATSGTYDVLVSNQNGPIKDGDYITVSSLDGIGMKAGTTQSYVLGKAMGGFDGKTNVLNTATLTNSNGTKETVALTLVPVDISIGHNPLNVAQRTGAAGLVVHFAQTLVNKQVDPTRAYLGMVILAITLIIVGIMAYAGVRNSIVSIGRNPLSRRSILLGLMEVGVSCLMIFLVGVFGVYLLLKL